MTPAKAVPCATEAASWRTATRLDRRIDEASTDGRAFQNAIDTFRAEMQRLAERQSHLEGRLDAGNSTGD